MKKALITGITGQDGSYLAELLLDKGYEVHGIIRRSSTVNTWRIGALCGNPEIYGRRLFLHYGDLSDSCNLARLLDRVGPDEIYNLAAQSHVKLSFDIPEYTADIDALGVTRLLDAVRSSGLKTRFYQAATSELYGNAAECPQNEQTEFRPRSPYAAAKLYGYWITRNYREAYGIHASNGILFNHESPRRGCDFVTRKITMAAVRIARGMQDCLYIGNINARRDWGYAPDFVRMMWMMMQQEVPDDYVIATGETHSVREFIDRAFGCVGISLVWNGSGVDEYAVDSVSGKTVVRIDPRFFRPTDVELLQGNPAKAMNKLGWKPEVKFSALVELMVKADEEAFASPSGDTLF